MTTMRTVTQNELGGPEVLQIAEVERPEPGYGEVLVKVHAAGTNPVDWKVRTHGGINGERTPYTVGWDVSGTVAAVGPGVRLFAVGDDVFGLPRFPQFAGGYGEYVTAPARHFAPKPAALTHVEAAAIPLAGLTAYQALVDVARLEPGQSVLVHAAAGGVGHLAVQIAKAKGAYVIGTASAAKHAYLKELGADEAIDYTAVDFAEAVSGVDVAIDAIGGEYTARTAPVVRDGGHLIILPDPAEVSAAEAARIKAGYMTVEIDRSSLLALAALAESGDLKPTIATTYPLEEAAEAHKALETGRTAGKIVLTVA